MAAPEEEPRREPPVMPTADEAGPDRVDAPGAVRASFWLWVLAGATGLLGAILLVVHRGTVVDVLAEANPALARGRVEETVKGLTVWLTAGSVMFLVFFVLLAHKVRGGIRKARTLLVVVGLFSALFQYAVGRLGLLGPVSALLTLLALAMLFMPSARRFFAESGR